MMTRPRWWVMAGGFALAWLGPFVARCAGHRAAGHSLLGAVLLAFPG